MKPLAVGAESRNLEMAGVPRLAALLDSVRRVYRLAVSPSQVGLTSFMTSA